ncbi:hypothetical protein L873DRAFT_1832487 [Choiromyces venosus 120613-1]|uniref:25S rRNA (uridine-N(3))-methyltransferase BMT5-like domain-containing protein n=1 Tax=Choiromyces venosus 120613-1 TaxID=1336337 RepID=A0A3N4K584_9PEZI|nr:hypothetical protein L873DRAFT_1832487 [Choiromyces venosus 120613-1]
MSKKRKHPSSTTSSTSTTKHHHPHKKQKPSSQPHQKPKPKPTTKQPPPSQQKPPTLFHSSSRILLLGEGDFSFAASLVRHHRVRHLTATSLDGEAELLEKYPQAAGNVAVVKGMAGGGGVVVYRIDAGAVGRVKAVRKRRGEEVPKVVVEGAEKEDGEDEEEEDDEGGSGKQEGERGKAVGFDVIAFMFPHIGGKSTHLDRQMRGNQQLLQSFFTSTKPLLSPTGIIVVTLFEGKQYDLWNIKGLAKAAGLQTRTSFKFAPEEYPGYVHARTLGNVSGSGGWKGEERDAKTFVFEAGDRGCGNDGGGSSSKQGKRKKQDDDSSDED